MSKGKSATVKDVNAAAFIRAYAAHLKKTGELSVPKWVDIVKTSTHHELGPMDPDWYYVRAAAVARRVYLRGGLGVGQLRRVFGSAANNGSAPHHFHTSSGSVARAVLKSLEGIKVFEKDPKGGRRITSSGQRDLDRIAGQVARASTA